MINGSLQDIAGQFALPSRNLSHFPLSDLVCGAGVSAVGRAAAVVGGQLTRPSGGSDLVHTPHLPVLFLIFGLVGMLHVSPI